MTRILHIAHFKSYYPGNFIASLSLLAKKASSNGDEMLFVFPTSPNLSYHAWMDSFRETHRVWLIDFDGEGFVSEVSQIILEEDVGVIHTSFLSTNQLIRIHRMAGKDRRYYQHIHSNPLYGRHLFLKKLRNCFMLPKDVTVIACSPSVAKACKSLYPLSPIVTIENGIDINRLNKKPKEAISHPIRFLMFGYNIDIKGVDLAVDAFWKIPEEKATLDIVVTTYYEEVKSELISKYGSLPGGVRLIAPESDVNKLYLSHDAFLSASRTEGFGYALVEAYYVGLPIIASDIQSSIDLGLPNVSYFQSGNALSLGDKLMTLIPNIGNVQNDRNYVSTHFSVDAWSDAVLSLYRKK